MMLTISMKYRFLLIILYLCVFRAIGQVTISGIVQNEEGQKLAGVSIYTLPGADHGTITDFDGKFTFVSRSQDTSVLISYTGFTTVRLSKPSVDTFLRITLIPSNNITACPTIIAPPEFTERVSAQRLDFIFRPPVTVTSSDQIFNTVPGVYMQSGSYNTNRLTIRGNGNRSPFATSGIKIYIDNIPIHSNIGESSIEDYGTTIIEKAEVIKGPTGVNFGSGLGGAIVIDTEGGLYQPKNTIESYNEVGPYGTYRTSNSISLGSKSGDSYRFKIHQSYLHSDGYRTNNIFDRNNLTLSYRLRMGDRHTFKILAHRTDLAAQIPSALSITDYNTEPRKAAFIWDKSNGNEDYTHMLGGLTHKYQINDNTLLNSTGYVKSLASLELRPFNTIAEDLNTIGGRIKLQNTSQIHYSNKLTTSIGIDYQRDKYDFTIYETLDSIQGGPVRDGIYRSNEISFNGNVKYKFDNWEINLGAAYIIHDLSKEEDVSSSDSKIFPTISILKKMGETKYYIRSGYGGNFPSWDQLSNEVEKLAPEFVWNIEGGVKGHSLKHTIGYRVAVYHMTVKDQFVQRFTVEGDAYQTNAGSTSLQGVEWSVRKTWSGNHYSSRLFETTFTGSYTHHRFDDFVDGPSDYSGNELTGSPSLTLGAEVKYRKQRLLSSLDFRHVSEIPMNDANTSFAEEYTLINATIGYDIISNRNWTVTLGSKIRNLLNEKYASMVSVNARSFGGAEPRFYYAGLPRHLFVSLQARYSW